MVKLQRAKLVVLVTVIGIATFLVLMPVLPQDQSYQAFADRHALFGISNFWVLSRTCCISSLNRRNRDLKETQAWQVRELAAGSGNSARLRSEQHKVENCYDRS